MGNFVLTDAKIMFGDYALGGISNEVQVQFSAEMLDETTFGSGGTRKNKPGLKTIQVTAKGFNDFDDTTVDSPDKRLFNRIQASAVPLSVAHLGQAEGDRVFMFNSVLATYNPIGGTVGEMLEFDFEARGQGAQPLVGGYLLGTGAKTVDGTGTGVQIGAVSSLQKLFAALHITAYSGLTDITVSIESDDNSGFTTPTTRLTFSLATGVSAQWATPVAGPITDDWWRAKWDVTGAGSATIFVSAGIQAL